jgi:hypothetical protein
VSDNTVVMTSDGTTTCHPYIDQSAQAEIACFWGCGHTFDMNSFPQPYLCSFGC